MSFRTIIAAAVLAGSLATETGLSAHHSVAGEFDGTEPITLQGVLTRVKWENPHIWFYLDVRDQSGKTVSWGIECAPPARVNAAGVKDLLKIGQLVTVNAYRARDKSRTDAHAYDMLLPDGRKFVIGIKLN